MIYNLSTNSEKQQAQTRFDFLSSKGATVEITEKKPIRSINQNSYLHLILSAFGCEFGYTLEEVKQYFFKEHINPDIFNNGEKEGLLNIQDWRSTADLDTKEMTTAIDRFLDYSAKNGYRLPEPSDLVWITELKRTVHNHKQYL